MLRIENVVNTHTADEGKNSNYRCYETLHHHSLSKYWEPPNAALKRLAHATTNKGSSPASSLQALVGRADCLVRSLWYVESIKPNSVLGVTEALVFPGVCKVHQDEKVVT